jgi:hypothetical protein
MCPACFLTEQAGSSKRSNDMQQSPFPPLTVVRLTASDELLTAGITRGKAFYLVHDEPAQRFHVVWWDRVHWLCSCDKGACVHKLAVNEFVFEESQQRRIAGDDQIVKLSLY